MNDGKVDSGSGGKWKGYMEFSLEKRTMRGEEMRGKRRVESNMWGMNAGDLKHF